MCALCLVRWIELDEYSGVKYARERGYACAPLPDNGCVNRSEDGSLLVMPGWGLSALAQSSYSGLGTGARAETVLFSCPAEDANCLGEGGNNTLCAEGSKGPLCAVCENDWVGGTDDGCTLCGASSQRRAMQQEERSSLGDGIKIAIIGGGQTVQRKGCAAPRQAHEIQNIHHGTEGEGE